MQGSIRARFLDAGAQPELGAWLGAAQPPDLRLAREGTRHGVVRACIFLPLHGITSFCGIAASLSAKSTTSIPGEGR